MFQTNPVAIMARKKLVKPQKTSTPVASPSSSSSSGGFLAPQEVSRVVREVASQCGQQELRLLLFTILEGMLNLKSNSPGSSWPP